MFSCYCFNTVYDVNVALLVKIVLNARTLPHRTRARLAVDMESKEDDDTHGTRTHTAAIYSRILYDASLHLPRAVVLKFLCMMCYRCYLPHLYRTLYSDPSTYRLHPARPHFTRHLPPACLACLPIVDDNLYHPTAYHNTLYRRAFYARRYLDTHLVMVAL